MKWQKKSSKIYVNHNNLTFKNIWSKVTLT